MVYKLRCPLRRVYPDLLPPPPQENKSTASGAKYARSSVIFPSPYGLCQGEVDAMKTGPKLNLIKKNVGKEGVGGGEGNPITLTVSSLVSEF